MPAPIVLAIAALGLLAVSCRREEEPPNTRKPEPAKVEPPFCEGNSYPLSIPGERLELCHGDKAKDGIFQTGEDSLVLRHGRGETAYQNAAEWSSLREKFGFPEMSGLSLGPWKAGREWMFKPAETWSLDAERMFSSAVDFCRERGIALSEARQLAAKTRPAKNRPILTPNEKAYALMASALLLSLRGDENFAKANPDFLKTVLEKIEAGKLRIRDLPKSGDKENPFNRATYSTGDNALLISEAALDFARLQDRATLLHELIHFYQDAQKRSLSMVEGETQAYMAEAEYALGERGLLRKGASLEDLETFMDREYPGAKQASHFPLLPAMRAAFYRAQGQNPKHQASLEACRNAVEASKSFVALVEVMKGPASPTRPGSGQSRFLEENGQRLKAPGGDKIFEEKIQELRGVKSRETQALRALPANSAKDPLMFQYFKVLKSSIDLYSMERLREKQGGRTAPDDIGELTEEIAALGANRRIPMSLDGVD